MTTSTEGASALAARFLTTIEAQPDAIAIITDDRHVSFEELGAIVAGTQQVLSDAGTRTVGLYSPPSVSLIGAAWAALCSGVPYVPLSPTYPDERVRFMAQDSGVDTIVAPAEFHDEVRAIVGDLDITIVDIRHQHDALRPRVTAGDDALAYVLYTSGSTGTPKGVEIDHRALAHQLAWLRTALNLGPTARIVHKTPISFDASQWELLAAVNGAATIVAGSDAYRDPQALVASVREHGATHLQAVPTLLQALCEEDGFARCTSLQVVASGGEVLSVRLAERLRALLPECWIVNLYGPTETTINASYHVYSTSLNSAQAGPAVAIGQPVPGLEFHLFDEQGRLSDAAAGELAISGPQLARGYRHRPDDTRERFVERLIAGERVRCYRTGDLVERREDKYFFRGRTDAQVKIRGHRIELGEVRATIENHDWVRHAEVLATRDASGAAQRLVAFVELNPHEAALMDQGVHGAHHQSKSSKVQVKAQVAGLGVRDDHAAHSYELPISPDDDRRLRELAFARKTYRTFHSTTTDLAGLTALSELVVRPREWPLDFAESWSKESLAFVLRSLIQYPSEHRLLPKYAYASPGALYGMQVYVSLIGIPGFADGVYYLNPRTARLQEALGTVDAPQRGPQVELILAAQRSVISSVYQTNVDEVLLFEAGHLLGLLDTVAPAAGHRLGQRR